MEIYQEGRILEANEYLLKIRPGSPDTGFLSKYNKNGSMPVSFKDWGKTYPDYITLPVFVIEEKFRSGWKLHGWRFGQSQNWASLVHPEGFTVEIYLVQFLEIISTNTIINGVIQGDFKWEDNKLIKR